MTLTLTQRQMVRTLYRVGTTTAKVLVEESQHDYYFHYHYHLAMLESLEINGIVRQHMGAGDESPTYSLTEDGVKIGDKIAKSGS